MLKLSMCLFCFSFGISLANATPQPCNFAEVKSVPQVIVVGEAHYEKADVLVHDTESINNFKASTEMRRTIFEKARQNQFVLGSEIYQSKSDLAEVGPFLPELKDREDKENPVFGIESEALLGLSSTYRIMYGFWSNQNKLLGSRLISLTQDALKFESHFEIFKLVLANESQDPLIKKHKAAITDFVQEISLLKKNTKFKNDAQLLQFGDVARAEFNRIERKFSSNPEFQELVQALLIRFHETQVSWINKQYKTEFKVMKEDDENLLPFLKATSDERDNVFAQQAKEILCDAGIKKYHYVVFNMGGAHVEGFQKALVSIVPMKVPISSYKTYEPDQLRAFKLKLSNIQTADPIVRSPGKAGR